MSISLVKGQKIDLTKGNKGLSKVVFALGWDTNRYDGNADFDLDVSAFFTDESGKVTGEQDFRILWTTSTYKRGFSLLWR